MLATFDQKCQNDYPPVRHTLDETTGEWRVTITLSHCREEASAKLLATVGHFAPDVRVSLDRVTNGVVGGRRLSLCSRSSPDARVERGYRPILQRLHQIFGTSGEVILTPTNQCTPGKYGSIENMPGLWLKSKATVSFVIYLVRTWAYMEVYPHYLELLGKTSPHRLPQRIPVTSIWRSTVKQLLFPMWFFTYGKQPFWLFLYTISQTNEQRAQKMLLQSNEINGFSTWAIAQMSNPRTPEWFMNMSALLYSRGSGALGEISLG